MFFCVEVVGGGIVISPRFAGEEGRCFALDFVEVEERVERWWSRLL